MSTGISDDMIMMYVIHDALRRDLEHLTRAVESQDMFSPERRDRFQAGWEVFKTWLHDHHSSEDRALWPIVRTHLASRPQDLALLDEMEAEHARIVPVMADLDAAVSDGAAGADRLPDLTAAFRRELVDHLRHEETDAVPLVESVMTKRDWRRFSRQMGVKGSAEFFPYILADGDPQRTAQAMGSFPPPLRLLIRRVWVPRYRKRRLWS